MGEGGGGGGGCGWLRGERGAVGSEGPGSKSAERPPEAPPTVERGRRPVCDRWCGPDAVCASDFCCRPRGTPHGARGAIHTELWRRRVEPRAAVHDRSCHCSG